MKKFYTQVRVLFADTDAMGIVYHGNYLRWFEAGRNEFLREIGFPYAELEKLPVWLPLAAAHLTYLAPARYDDLLEITTWPSRLTYATVRMNYEARQKESGELLVKGYTDHAITDDQLKLIRAKKICPEVYETIQKIVEENEAEDAPQP
ncbi:MAG: acyl-CoA thioesterase [Clostridiales Family XIII bacterium]|jgi:acyl-CoA thioester hydrolase|nr:acyl-CoA thioesterase [Clostridiales Family XIII bacterium]